MEVVNVVVTEVAARGLPDSTTRLGLVSVMEALVYVPVGTLVKLKGTEKSIRQAKSSVTGDVEDTTETGVPPPSGVKVMPVIVTVNDTTSQAGASPVKTTAEPMVVGCCVVVLDDEDVAPPEQLITTANAANEITSRP